MMGAMGLGRRVRGFAWLAPAGMFASLAWSPATVAQEERERRDAREERVWWVTGDDRPRLGVYLGRSTGGEDGGVVVVGVSEGGPAAEAGIREGDVIVSLAGHTLSQPLDEEGVRSREWSAERRLRALMGDVAEGDEIEVGIDREGEALTFTVVPRRGPFTYFLRPELDSLSIHLRDVNERVREMMDEVRDRYEEAEWPFRAYSDGDARVAVVPGLRDRDRDWDVRFAYSALGSRHGLDLVELNADLGAYFGTAEGVLVADVDEDSPLGLRPGDVVVAVEGREVDDAAELRRILRSYTEDEEIEFRIWRDGAQTTIVGSIDRP